MKKRGAVYKKRTRHAEPLQYSCVLFYSRAFIAADSFS